ncbi:hypothetical protein KGF56_004071 [Candida oxycetoniae]|uniref:Glutathione S-transferase n=1 Tax=Candida oxycetoniae TaxID=497107 RepID=A0AAI9SUC2_9ASCO|nr:uncharacterized protein KGF56_004071 [Candida oxycetoniae]KAI3403182.1 hypothetical protein KGF56_004071 [Candida oxycetoniae]
MALLPIKLYTAPTPNGFKISIFLEVLGLKYDSQIFDISKGETKQNWFVELNPNGRIPVIVDPNVKGEGKGEGEGEGKGEGEGEGEGKGEGDNGGLVLSQTGAILQYLADTYDKEHKYSYPFGSIEYYKTLEYLIFQVSENGPIQGQANHFVVFAKEKVPYGINRYLTDTKRIYDVYEDILSRNKNNGSKYLVGDRYTIADFALLGWAFRLPRLNIDIHSWPLLGKWFDELTQIPAVQRGLIVPPH